MDEIAYFLEFSYNSNIIGYQNEYILSVGGIKDYID